MQLLTCTRFVSSNQETVYELGKAVLRAMHGKYYTLFEKKVCQKAVLFAFACSINKYVQNNHDCF
jgi:hypothetical protein